MALLWSLIVTYGWAERAHISSVGSSQDGSLSVPALMIARSAGASGSVTIGEQQAVQNRRAADTPVSSPTVVNEPRASPWIARTSRGTPTTTEKAVPVCRWQLVQWQRAVKSGSASNC